MNSTERTIPVDKHQILEDLNAAELKTLIPTIIFLSIIALVGLLGNSLVIHVYRTKYKFSNIKYFILSLSAVDLFSSCVAIPLEIMTVLDQYTVEYGWLCKLSRFLNAICTNSSTLLLILIAVDRFRRIWNPFGWQIRTYTAKYSSVLSIVIATTVSWPAIILYGKGTFVVPEYNLTGSECGTDDGFEDTPFPATYSHFFSILFLTCITLLVILYCLIGLKVRCHARRMSRTLGRKSIKGQTENQASVRKTTFIMLLVTMAFILSFLPHLIVREFNDKLDDDQSNISKAVYRMFTRSYFLNCAVNPVIYSLFDSRFRLACKNIMFNYKGKTDNFTAKRKFTSSGLNSSNEVTQVTSFIGDNKVNQNEFKSRSKEL